MTAASSSSGASAQTADSAPVLLGHRGDVLDVTFNRPAQRNAVDLPMAQCMGQLAPQIAATRAKVIVLRASGPAFMAGGDITRFDVPGELGAILDNFHAFIRALADSRASVVASVQGAIAGGGLSLALNADLIIAADSAKFSFAYRQLGTSPDGGCTYQLPRLVGGRKAFALLMLGEMMTAQQALAQGLVTEVVPHAELEQRTCAVVAQLCANAAESAAQIRKLLQAGAERSLVEQLDAERAAFLTCSATADFREGVSAFLGKRSPRFQTSEQA